MWAWLETFDAEAYYAAEVSTRITMLDRDRAALAAALEGLQS
jgi:hypothetical protein